MKGKKEKGKIKKGFKIAVLVGIGIVILFAIVKIVQFLPLGFPKGDDYFKPIGERLLQADEEGQWKFILEEYDLLEYSGDTFGDWDVGDQTMWKYGIAFCSYGMPSLALIDSENSDMVTYTMWIMIKKMKSKKVWIDWMEFGFGEDPITYHNIMYKGHLNLMYGLYQLMSGDDRFSREYTWLTQRIVKEMRDHHKEGLYEGTNCEPDQYFVQCNSIGLLSLYIYDKLYGTEYTKNEVSWVLDFIKKRMTDPETGLYWLEYHPSHDNVERFLSGYTNAWAIVFLRPLDPEYNEKLYPVWKKTFVKEIGPYAYVSEVPGGGPSGLSTMFGMWAAKEYGDVELFTKLRNSVDKDGELVKEPEIGMMLYRNLDNALMNGAILATKIHVGWKVILDHDWGYDTPFTIPDTSGMTWKDILPQEIHEMEGDKSTAIPEDF